MSAVVHNKTQRFRRANGSLAFGYCSLCACISILVFECSLCEFCVFVFFFC